MNNPRQVAQRFIDAIDQGRFSDAFNMLAVDGVYRVVGKTRASGSYHGREELFGKLVPIFATFKVPPVIKFEPPIVDGDRAVILGTGSGEGLTGPFASDYAFVMRIAGDGFSEIVEFLDTEVLQTSLFGKRLVEAWRSAAPPQDIESDHIIKAILPSNSRGRHGTE